jgi:hypothetical protein
LDLKEQTSAAEIKEIDKAKLALSVCNYHLYSLLKFYTKNAVWKKCSFFVLIICGNCCDFQGRNAKADRAILKRFFY